MDPWITPTISPRSINFLKSIGEPVTVSDNTIRLPLNALLFDPDHPHKDVFIELPRILESIESLEFCGYTKEKATQIFEIYDGCCRGDYETEGYWHDSMRKMVRYHMKLPCYPADFNAVETDDDETWDDALKKCNVEKWMREGLLDPAHRTMRNTKSARTWAVELVTGAYDFLSSCNEQIWLYQTYIQWDNPAFENPAFGLYDKHFNPHLYPKLPVIEGEIPLYKGGFLHRLLKGIQNYEYNDCEIIGYGVHPSGKKRLALDELIDSRGPDKDFQWDHIANSSPALYFTPHLPTAKSYAALLQRASNKNIPFGVLQLNLPPDFPPEKPYLLTGEWKEMIWRSRKGFDFDEERCEKFSNQRLMIGCIPAQSTAVIKKMKSWGDVESMKSEDGTYPLQYGFVDDPGKIRDKIVDKLSKRCLDKVGIIHLEKEGEDSDWCEVREDGNCCRVDFG